MNNKKFEDIAKQLEKINKLNNIYQSEKIFKLNSSNLGYLNKFEEILNKINGPSIKLKEIFDKMNEPSTKLKEIFDKINEPDIRLKEIINSISGTKKQNESIYSIFQKPNFDKVLNNMYKNDFIKENFFKKKVSEGNTELETALILEKVSNEIEENLTEIEIESFSSNKENNEIIKNAQTYNSSLSPKDIYMAIILLYVVTLIFNLELKEQIPILIKEKFGKIGIWTLDRWEYICFLVSIFYQHGKDNK